GHVRGGPKVSVFSGGTIPPRPPLLTRGVPAPPYPPGLIRAVEQAHPALAHGDLRPGPAVPEQRRHQVLAPQERGQGPPPPAGDHDVLLAGPGGEHADHLVHVYPAPLHRVGELVEHVQPVGLRGQVALDLGPALGRLLRVPPGVALDPGPALAHLVPADRAALAGPADQPERAFLADPPLRRLDELEDPDRPPLV